MYKLENNVEWTDDLKNAFKHGITKGKIKYIDDNNQEVVIDYDNGLKSFKLYDEKNVPNQGFIGQATARQVDLELINTLNVNNLENKEFELFLGADIGKIPKTYQEVEYIEGNGTQYLDLGFKGTNNHGIEIEFAYTSTSSDVNARLFGTREGSGGTNAFAYLSSSNGNCSGSYYIASNGGYASGLNTSQINTNFHNIKINVTNDKKVYFDNNLIFTGDNTEYIATYNTRLFNSYNGSAWSSTCASAKIKKLKIYENNILIKNLVPCYRKGDNKIGMYDVINNIFYINQGTRTFLKGNDIDNTYYINYGKFIVNQAPENDVTNGIIKITALDYMIKSNIPYVPNVTFPCTLKAVTDDICTQTGLILATQNFANSNFIVDSNQFDGKTCREALRHIGKCAFSWVRIGQDNRLYIDFSITNTIAETITINDYYQDKFKKANEYFGAINRVVYAESNIQGQEEKVEDTDDIALNGLHELVIYDNYFAYTTEKRQQLIQAGTRLFGLKYMPVQQLEMTGLVYLEATDLVKVNFANNEFITTLPLNHIIEYTGAVSDSLTSETNSNNETTYKNTNAPINANSLAEVIVDRAMREIRAIVDYYVNFLHNKSGNNNIFIEGTRDGEGYITKFIIKGNTTYFTETNITIVASEGVKNEETALLTQSQDTLLTESNDVILAESKSLYISKKNIILDAPLRNLIIDNINYYDELQILQDGTIQIIRRIGISPNETLYLLDKEETTILEDKFVLPSKEAGLYYFIEELDNLDYYAEYIIKNEYSDIYATEAYVNAGLKLKVDTENLISELNASADIIKLVGQRLIILMQNYSLDEKGYMKALVGEIAGFLFTDKKFSKEFDTIYEFTLQDIQLLVGFLEEYNTIPSGLQQLYDLVGDSQLTVNDVVKMINIIYDGAENTNTASGSVSIKSDNSNELIEITNNLNVNKTRFGVFSIYSYLLSADVISLSDIGTNVGSIRGIIMDRVKRKITVANDNNQTIILPTGITTPTVTQTSRADDKKDFEKMENALEEVINTDIYKYHLKSQQDDDKKHIGFVIGDNFKYSHFITAEDEKKQEIGVDTYSMVSVLWKAVQEQQEQIEKLKEEIKNLKGEK